MSILFFCCEIVNKKIGTILHYSSYTTCNKKNHILPTKTHLKPFLKRKTTSPGTQYGSEAYVVWCFRFSSGPFRSHHSVILACIAYAASGLGDLDLVYLTCQVYSCVFYCVMLWTCVLIVYYEGLCQLMRCMCFDVCKNVELVLRFFFNYYDLNRSWWKAQMWLTMEHGYLDLLTLDFLLSGWKIGIPFLNCNESIPKRFEVFAIVCADAGWIHYIWKGFECILECVFDFVLI